MDKDKSPNKKDPVEEMNIYRELAQDYSDRPVDLTFTQEELALLAMATLEPGPKTLERNRSSVRLGLTGMGNQPQRPQRSGQAKATDEWFELTIDPDDLVGLDAALEGAAEEDEPEPTPTKGPRILRDPLD